MTKGLFSELDVYHDDAARSAAMNMAIDEALLASTRPAIRFYQWDHPALSFGYFGKYAEVADHADERDLVRRWTGGGIVFHGEDLTYAIVIPASDPAFAESSPAIYEKIHGALRDALSATGARAELASVAGSSSGNADHACFANPVIADVMIDAQKVAGAAHRRTRAALLHQGSVQCEQALNGLAERFTGLLSTRSTEAQLSDQVLERATAIAAQKYRTTTWLKRR